MLCSKCHEIIPKEKEIQISGTIFCKTCAESDKAERNIITKCNTCSKLIFNNELTHEVHENWGVESSEKLVLCQSCHKWWLRRAKSRKRTWELMKWFDNFSKFSMWLVLAFITIDKNRDHVQLSPTLLIIFMLATCDMLLSPFTLLFIEKIAEWKYKRDLKNTKKKQNKKLLD